MISQCKAIKTAAKLVLFVELHKFLWNDYRAVDSTSKRKVSENI